MTVTTTEAPQEMIPRPRCATCRHMRGGGDHRDDWCGRVEMGFGPLVEPGGAQLSNSSAFLYVAPDFGCVMWEAKP